MVGVVSAKNPLSRAPGKKKLLVAVPMALVSGLATVIGLPLAEMFFIGFLAYAIVGLIEVLLGSTLQNAGKAWDQLSWWKQSLISVLVIVSGLVLAMVAIPYFA